MLPTFFVWNELNEKIKKCSDFDKMIEMEQRVGFSDEIESNIAAAIDMKNCKPGYLRLMITGNGGIFQWTGNIESLNNKALQRIIARMSHLYKHKFDRGPATTKIYYADSPNVDEVFYYSCPSWPPIARTWIDRERPSNWPSKEIIRGIVSKGCRIVHKPHPKNYTDPDAEFRFSFSEAELILFNALSEDQKKCFIAFKALVKYRIYRSEIITKSEIDLTTYHLKTIFLWTCETIPADQWQTTTGWARCLLYMIDQLYACLKSRTLPGYFIEECNLMDSIELPQKIVSEIKKLRRNPITSAATFLDSTRCFHHSHFKLSDHIQELCRFNHIKEIVLKRHLIFLQKMSIEMDSTRGVKLWRKEAVLRIFATWCHQNSHEIHLAPWQCLASEMTLFDVVHLDIWHGFDVPNHVLLEYIDREWSAEIVCKLAVCYSMKALTREDRYNKFEYSLHFKTLLMIHRAVNNKHPTSESIIISVSILMRYKEYKMAAKVLELAIIDCLFDRTFIRCKELFAEIFSHKMTNEMQEMSDIKHADGKNVDMVMLVSNLICFSLSVCYKYHGNEKKS